MIADVNIDGDGRIYFEGMNYVTYVITHLCFYALIEIS